MANIDPAPSWANIRRLETTDRNMAGPGGILNDPTTSIAARLNLLRDNDTTLGNSVAEVNSRLDATDTAIANIQGQVLTAPGTLSDLENGAALDPAAAFPDVPSVENSLGPVDAINQSIDSLASRSKKLRDDISSLSESLSGQAGASLIGLSQGGTVQDAIKYLTPEQFGAIGDAVFNPNSTRATGTDNTVALQNMLNEASRLGAEVRLSPGAKYLTGSLYLYNDPILNPNWSGRPGRIRITGPSLGHATGDVEKAGAAIIHKGGETSPLISCIGSFSLEAASNMGGYIQIERVNLIGSPETEIVVNLSGVQGACLFSEYTVKVTNPSGHGIVQSTVWEIVHRNGLIRGGNGSGAGTWTGIGLWIRSDDSTGQTNMSIYENVDCYRMGTGIRIGRNNKANGTLGPITFIGGQSSLCNHYGIWLEGGPISFTSIGQQVEESRLNAIRIDRTLDDGASVASDLTRSVKFINTYITGCGLLDDGTVNSYGIYIANGDGIEFDSTVFNRVGNGIAFDAGNVDNLIIRRPTFRTAREYGVSSGYGIRAFGLQSSIKRQYLEKPVFNQNPSIPIDSVARQIFALGQAGHRQSINNGSSTPDINMGLATGSESFRILNFNNQVATDISNITGGTEFQTLTLTFSNNLTTIKNNRTNIFLNGSDFIGSSRGVLVLFRSGTVWVEVSRTQNSA